VPAVASKPRALAADIRQLIEVARQQVAQAVNAGLTTLYWQIGARIRQDILKNERAEYGAEIVATLGRQLETEFGRGFGEKNLRRMVQFAETFPDAEIVAAVRRQFRWTHFTLLIPMQDALKRDFYAEMCRVERWSTRALRQKIDGMLYERTALSRKPDQLIRRELDKLRAEDALTPDLVLQDPYLLDFLGLKDTYSEKDLESALLREIERFLLELGVGFAFVERQKRITLDGDDYYIDLLFFHRRLRCLVIVDLKLGKFTHADAGQMHVYLGYARDHWVLPGESAPVGLILCAEKDGAVARYALDGLPNKIIAAEYRTALPNERVLAREIDKARRLLDASRPPRRQR